METRFTTDLDSKHFHIFCNTIIYSDGGKRLERVGTKITYESNNDSQEATTSHNKSNTNHNESK